MLVIYDLDKTSIYCPIALWLDNQFWIKKLLPTRLFYALYTPVYIFEMITGLFKVNPKIYERAKIYRQLSNVKQCVITARHNTFITRLQKKLVFKDLDNEVELYCTANGITGQSKAILVRNKITSNKNRNILMYDDNFYELAAMKLNFKNTVQLKTEFLGKNETVTQLC